jgi:hypothetical protein
MDSPLIYSWGIYLPTSGLRTYLYLPTYEVHLTYQLTYLHTHLPMQNKDKEILPMVYLKVNYGLLRDLPRRLGNI